MISRSLPARLALVLALVCSVLMLDSPAGAQEPPADVDMTDVPEGFMDGVPVGSDDVPPIVLDESDEADSGDMMFRTASAPITRHFGQGAYGALVTAANSVNPNPACSVSLHGRMALILAPVFGESSAATSASAAPSPMTLSRADEWTTGVKNGNNNTNANYGLYAFENPSTPYKRAYWHPGIGIWQYDSAGLGAPYIAPELMNPNVVGRDVAQGMLDRYCAAKNAGRSDKNARLAAWSPWVACHKPADSDSRCEKWFHDLRLHESGTPSGNNSGFEYLRLVPGIDALGGAQRRNCNVGGSRSIACWYVDPAKAQPSRQWWATADPSGGSPTVRPTPLSYPFYVYKRGGREHRVWLAEDTNYGIDIAASRELGQNARPRTGQPKSGLTWSRTTNLCDLTADRGRCGGSTTPPPTQSTVDPFAPSGMRTSLHTVNGTTYRPLIGDFDGDGLSDVLFYAPGAVQDYVWWSDRNGGFSSVPVTVGGNYKTLVGDIDGNGTDDVVWYNGSSSYVWLGTTGRRFTSLPVSLPSNRTVFLADIGGNGKSNVVAYGPGTASDHILTWQRRSFSSRSITVNGHFTPVVGNFDGRGGDDILWYAPGPATDYVWWTSGSSIASTVVTVNGTYEPLVGDFDGDGIDDVMWYGVGAMPDYTWFGATNRRFSSRHTPVTGDYIPIVADLGGDGRDDIVWYAPGPGTDYWWRYNTRRQYSSGVLSLSGHYIPGAGVFGSGRDGIFWYGPGSATDALWYV